LDFEALQYRGALAFWSTAERACPVQSGASRSSASSTSAIFHSATCAPPRRFGNVEGSLFGGWYLLGGLRHEERKLSVPFPQEGSYKGSGGEAGVRYLTSPERWGAFKLRALEARFIDRALNTVALLDEPLRC
jgi:hypothetical protein